MQRMAAWQVGTKYVVICEEGNSGSVWHLCDFEIYHVLEELFVV